MGSFSSRGDFLDQLARAAREYGASYFGGGLLFLMPAARRVFFPFLAERFPHLLRKYEERYTQNAYLRGEYADPGVRAQSRNQPVNEPPNRIILYEMMRQQPSRFLSDS